jgi:hypothetical protein
MQDVVGKVEIIFYLLAKVIQKYHFEAGETLYIFSCTN